MTLRIHQVGKSVCSIMVFFVSERLPVLISEHGKMNWECGRWQSGLHWKCCHT